MQRRSVLTGSALVASSVASGCAATRVAAAAGAQRRFSEGVAEVKRAVRGPLGAAVIDAANGATYAWRSDERFPMYGTAKLGKAATLLRRVDLGLKRLDRRIVLAASELVTFSQRSRVSAVTALDLTELCEAAMTLSNNGAANYLMRSYNGSSGFTAFFREIGDMVTRLDRWETELNSAIPGDERDTTSPNAMAATVRKIVLGDVLTPKSRDFLHDVARGRRARQMAGGGQDRHW